MLAPFDLKAETRLLVDAAVTGGLGFCLIQKQGEHWRLIECGSRFLTDPETRWAPIELESCAIYWAIKQCNTYLRGLPHFTVVSDHKPLKPIYNDHLLAKIENPKIQAHRSKLLPFNFTVVWQEGKTHFAPDCLSRNPVDQPTAEDEADSAWESFAVVAAISVNTDPDPLLKGLAECVDADYGALINAVRTRQYEDKSDLVKHYKINRHELSVDNGLVMRNTRIVVPKAARADMLRRLHVAHAGIVKTKKRARETLDWPGMSKDIETMIAACPECVENRPALAPEPEIVTPSARAPFESVSADLFYVNNTHYLAITDRYSGYIVARKFNKDPSSTMVINALMDVFTTYSIPREISADAGPQFRGQEMDKFLKEYGIIWRQSSSYFPQSNGHAEAGVRDVKAILKKLGLINLSDKRVALAIYERNCTAPAVGKLSPHEMMFGYRPRTTIPSAKSSALLPKGEREEEAERRNEDRVTKATAKSKKRRTLKPIMEGERVFSYDVANKRWDTSRVRVVVNNLDYRSYLIADDSRFDNGWRTKRNRRHLILCRVLKSVSSKKAKSRENSQRGASSGRAATDPEKNSDERTAPKPRRSKRIKKAVDRLQAGA